MTRQDVVRDYEVRDGRIVSPGKFEGEMVYSPYFYDSIMDGCYDDEEYEGDVLVDYFNVTDEDRKEFPELEGVNRVRCYEDGQGFFYCESV